MAGYTRTKFGQEENIDKEHRLCKHGQRKKTLAMAYFAIRV